MRCVSSKYLIFFTLLVLFTIEGGKLDFWRANSHNLESHHSSDYGSKLNSSIPHTSIKASSHFSDEHLFEILVSESTEKDDDEKREEKKRHKKSYKFAEYLTTNYSVLGFGLTFNQGLSFLSNSTCGKFLLFILFCVFRI